MINELRDLWLNRGTANYLPASTIYEINLSHVTKMEEKNKFDISTKQAKLSEKNLILEVSFSNFGFDPTTRKFSYKVAFNRDPSVIFKRFDTLTVVEPNSLSVNIFSTLKKFVEEFKTLHLLDHHICQVFLYFSKSYLPNNYSALARFGALCDDLLPNVLVLLSRCQMDADDEVRDRATYFKAILEQHEASLNSQYILNNLQVESS